MSVQGFAVGLLSIVWRSDGWGSEANFQLFPWFITMTIRLHLVLFSAECTWATASPLQATRPSMTNLVILWSLQNSSFTIYRSSWNIEFCSHCLARFSYLILILYQYYWFVSYNVNITRPIPKLTHWLIANSFQSYKMSI